MFNFGSAAALSSNATKINSIPDIPKLVQEDCSSDSSDEEKWEEIEEEAEETKCLFSDKVFSSLDDAIRHLRTSYNFDLAEMKVKYSMDFYSYIKVCCWFVNCSCSFLQLHLLDD